MYLKEFIEVTGISVKDLAKRANVSTPVVQKLLDNRNINSDSMKKIFLATKEIAMATKKFATVPAWLEEPSPEPAIVPKAQKGRSYSQGDKIAYTPAPTINRKKIK